MDPWQQVRQLFRGPVIKHQVSCDNCYQLFDADMVFGDDEAPGRRFCEPSCVLVYKARRRAIRQLSTPIERHDDKIADQFAVDGHLTWTCPSCRQVLAIGSDRMTITALSQDSPPTRSGGWRVRITCDILLAADPIVDHRLRCPANAT